MLIYQMPENWNATCGFSADELENQFLSYSEKNFTDRISYENQLFDSVRKIGMEVLSK